MIYTLSITVLIVCTSTLTLKPIWLQIYWLISCSIDILITFLLLSLPFCLNINNSKFDIYFCHCLNDIHSTILFIDLLGIGIGNFVFTKSILAVWLSDLPCSILHIWANSGVATHRDKSLWVVIFLPNFVDHFNKLFWLLTCPLATTLVSVHWHLLKR